MAFYKVATKGEFRGGSIAESRRQKAEGMADQMNMLELKRQGGFKTSAELAQERQARKDQMSDDERELVMRAVYGVPQGKKNFNQSMREGLAQPEGQRPAYAEAFSKDPQTYETWKLKRKGEFAAANRGGRGADQSEAALTYLQGLETGKDNNGKPFTEGYARHEVSRRFKSVKFETDPRFDESFARFREKEEDEPGGLMGLFRRGASAISSVFPGGGKGGVEGDVADLQKKLLARSGGKATSFSDIPEPDMGLDEELPGMGDPEPDEELALIQTEHPDAIQLSDGSYGVVRQGKLYRVRAAGDEVE